jgi:serine protease Do
MSHNSHPSRRSRLSIGGAVVLVSIAGVGLGVRPSHAEDGSAPAAGGIEALAAKTRPSIVVVKTAGRTGEDRGLGTGFVIAADGLIATNFHVIGEDRDFRVEFADGRSFRPTEILATDRAADLAIVRVDGTDLPPLDLGDSAQLVDGQAVFALGNPLGLEFSVTKGIVAARRVLKERSMIQVAIPIEPGSSGSPLLDLSGQVIGILAIKSSGALGFAVPVNDLKRLLANPHPIGIERWRKIGALETRDWEPILGGEWRQRAGQLIASGTGSGFGGRMLCLARRDVPASFDLEVDVRLDDEGGAAGLAFHSDGAHNHYGFYPTAGALRLTRFEGPTVFQWTILETVGSDAYRPGEWNRLRARVDGQRLTCSVNGTVVIELNDAGLTRGRIGLVKFRKPGARFRNLRLADKLGTPSPSPAAVARVTTLLEALPDGPVPPTAIEELVDVGSGTSALILERASRLDREVRRLRHLADDVHRNEIIRRLTELLVTQPPKDAPDLLLHCALLVARLDNREIEVQVYLDRMDRMAEELSTRFSPTSNEEDKLKLLLTYLFEDLGFRGSNQLDYHHRSNSYINEVLDDREGLPITLAVVCIELAKRVGLPVHGLGVPRHFLAVLHPGEPDERLIDAFSGQIITREDAQLLTGTQLEAEDLIPATERAIVTRMLRNLRGAAERRQDAGKQLRYLDTLVAIEENPVYSRGARAMLHYQSRRYGEAALDLDWLIEREPAGIDLDALRRMRSSLRELGI